MSPRRHGRRKTSQKAGSIMVTLRDGGQVPDTREGRTAVGVHGTAAGRPRTLPTAAWSTYGARRHHRGLRPPAPGTPPVRRSSPRASDGQLVRRDHGSAAPSRRPTVLERRGKRRRCSAGRHRAAQPLAAAGACVSATRSSAWPAGGLLEFCRRAGLDPDVLEPHGEPFERHDGPLIRARPAWESAAGAFPSRTSSVLPGGEAVGSSCCASASWRPRPTGSWTATASPWTV